MKRYFFLSIILASSLAASAYTPLVREGVRWVNLMCDVSFNHNYNPEIDNATKAYIGHGEFAYFMEFRGDTVINRLPYKKLYASLTREFDEHTLCPIAFMREENKHVYAIMEPKGQYQYEEDYNLSLGIDWTRVEEWEEVEVYDFNDMEKFLKKNMTGTFYENEWRTCRVDTATVMIEGEPRLSYQINEYYIQPDTVLANTLFTITEGVGNDQGNFLHLGTISFPRCICPVQLGLAQQENLQGETLLEGRWHYGPYQPEGNEDVSNVSHMIDVVLGLVPFSRHYLHDDYCDTNGDYVIDITDINNMIDIILGK